METTDEPVGYFITWTVYGTFLQGDERWWRKKRRGSQAPQPRLEQWHRDRLKHDVILLSPDDREIVASEIRSHCEYRQWRVWIANPRTNHVHTVVTGSALTPTKSWSSQFCTPVKPKIEWNTNESVRHFD